MDGGPSPVRQWTAGGGDGGGHVVVAGAGGRAVGKPQHGAPLRPSIHHPTRRHSPSGGPATQARPPRVQQSSQHAGVPWIDRQGQLLPSKAHALKSSRRRGAAQCSMALEAPANLCLAQGPAGAVSAASHRHLLAGRTSSLALLRGKTGRLVRPAVLCRALFEFSRRCAQRQRARARAHKGDLLLPSDFGGESERRAGGSMLPMNQGLAFFFFLSLVVSVSVVEVVPAGASAKTGGWRRGRARAAGLAEVDVMGPNAQLTHSHDTVHMSNATGGRAKISPPDVGNGSLQCHRHPRSRGRGTSKATATEQQRRSPLLQILQGRGRTKHHRRDAR